MPVTEVTMIETNRGLPPVSNPLLLRIASTAINRAPKNAEITPREFKLSVITRDNYTKYSNYTKYMDRMNVRI
jgi:hypothetical protein